MRRGAGVFNFQQMEKQLLFSLILLFWFILRKNPYKGFQRIVAPVKSVAGKEATAQPTAGGPAWFPGEDERGWDVPATWSKPGTLICSEYLLNTSKTILGRNTIKRNLSLSLWRKPNPDDFHLYILPNVSLKGLSQQRVGRRPGTVLGLGALVLLQQHVGTQPAQSLRRHKADARSRGLHILGFTLKAGFSPGATSLHLQSYMCWGWCSQYFSWEAPN